MASSEGTLPTRPRNSRGRSSLARLWDSAIFSDDHAITTRGQHLPSIIQQRSRSSGSNHRRTSHLLDDDLESASGLTSRTRTRPSSPDRERKSHAAWEALMTRSQRLIGDSSPRIEWRKYWKSPEDLKGQTKAVKTYYERTNSLILRFAYIDRLLNSSMSHRLIQEYTDTSAPSGSGSLRSASAIESLSLKGPVQNLLNIDQISTSRSPHKIQRTPRNLFRVPENEVASTTQDEFGEDDPLLGSMAEFMDEEDQDSSAPIVMYAIYVNLVANIILLAGKLVVTILSSSVSVLASLVDAVLDLLSTLIIFMTTYLISQHRLNHYKYPIGRRRLEPIGVLIFSIIMITSFSQVALEATKRLAGPHQVVELTVSSIFIMASTVAIKFGCWLWCRLIKNSSVQALAQDAMTDVVFNTFSIIFPLVGYGLRLWWLDPLGGILLSVYIMINWGRTSSEHIANLTGKAASLDERTVILYLTMRFATKINKIQGLNVYHTGDKLNVEVDIILDEHTTLRDSHDLGESLQYVLESIPSVDRAFVHMDYIDWNLPTHLNQQA